MSANWITRKLNDHYFVVDDNTRAVGSIRFDGVQWEVDMLCVSVLNYRSGNFDRCIGYVHGVEQMYKAKFLRAS